MAGVLPEVCPHRDAHVDKLPARVGPGGGARGEGGWGMGQGAYRPRRPTGRHPPARTRAPPPRWWEGMMGGCCAHLEPVACERLCGRLNHRRGRAAVAHATQQFLRGRSRGAGGGGRGRGGRQWVGGWPRVVRCSHMHRCTATGGPPARRSPDAAARREHRCSRRHQPPGRCPSAVPAIPAHVPPEPFAARLDHTLASPRTCMRTASSSLLGSTA